MKIAIIQTDNRTDNQVFNQMFRLNRLYCKLHNYDYFNQSFNVEQIKCENQELMLNDEDIYRMRTVYNRYNVLLNYIKKYDYIVFLDSDAFIANPTIKIQDIIDNEHEFYISQDNQLCATTIHLLSIGMLLINYCNNNHINYLKNPDKELYEMKIFNAPIIYLLRYLATNPQGYNSGFMIIKNTNIMRQFIEDIKKHYILFEDYHIDQGLIYRLQRSKKYKKYVKLLPLKTQGNGFFNDSEFGYNEQQTYICHFYGNNGISDEKMKQVIEQIKQNKWWKLYLGAEY